MTQSGGQQAVGKVKWFDTEKGYGFISVDGMEKDVFLHAKQVTASNVAGPLNEGDSVRFNLNSGPKGAFATNLSRVGGPN